MRHFAGTSYISVKYSVSYPWAWLIRSLLRRELNSVSCTPSKYLPPLSREDEATYTSLRVLTGLRPACAVGSGFARPGSAGWCPTIYGHQYWGIDHINLLRSVPSKNGNCISAGSHSLYTVSIVFYSEEFVVMQFVALCKHLPREPNYKDKDNKPQKSTSCPKAKTYHELTLQDWEQDVQFWCKFAGKMYSGPSVIQTLFIRTHGLSEQRFLSIMSLIIT